MLECNVHIISSVSSRKLSCKTVNCIIFPIVYLNYTHIKVSSKVLEFFKRNILWRFITFITVFNLFSKRVSIKELENSLFCLFRNCVSFHRFDIYCLLFTFIIPFAKGENGKNCIRAFYARSMSTSTLKLCEFKMKPAANNFSLMNENGKSWSLLRRCWKFVVPLVIIWN